MKYNSQKKIESRRNISHKEALKLLDKEYLALDPHCHSSFSFDVPDVNKTSPEEIITFQKKQKLMQTITDHDNINAYNYLLKKNKKIIPAVELTFKPKIARKIITNKPIQTLHINIFELSNKDLSIILDIAKIGDLDKLVTYLRRKNLPYMYNHPFYHEKKEKLNWKIIPDLTKHYFDVVELNAAYPKRLNDINHRIAQKLSVGIVAASDNHTGSPGRSYVIAKGKNFKEFWNNVKRGNSYVVRREMNTWDIVRETSIMINQAFYANRRQRSQRKFTPASSIEPIDAIVKSVTTGKLKNRYIIKRALHMIFQGINYTAGPILAWRLHVTKNETRAEKIRSRMRSITNKLLTLKEKIKLKNKSRILKIKNNKMTSSLP